MDRQQLVDGYLNGQLSRRVFLRRVVATGVGLATATAFADLLTAEPARAAARDTYDYYEHVEDFFFQKKSLKIGAFGKIIEWSFNSQAGHFHSVTDPSRWLDSGFVHPAGAYDRQMPYAGSFAYKCAETNHATMKGNVKIPMQVSPLTGTRQTNFQLAWGGTYATGQFKFDVQVKKPGQTKFSAFQTGIGEYLGSYTAQTKGTHSFRARLRNTDINKSSGWSPVVSIQVN
jgi:plastocyanin